MTMEEGVAPAAPAEAPAAPSEPPNGPEDELAALRAELQASGARAEELRAEAVRLEAENLRRRVAHEEGVPAEAFEFLSGDTEEGIRAQARKLTGLIAQQPVQAGTNTQPPHRQEPGFDEQIAAAYRAGNQPLAIRLKRLKAGLG